MLIPFRSRARTVDHLGREQIADCPTAISELWKNAYDAYARNVALHIFDGRVPIAAIVDDGHGMDLEEFKNKWLMLGTESKVSEIETPEIDRNGLEPRVRQGKKGIGRLSVASLGPVCLVISKRRGKPYVASMLDWRLFENPYLILEDVLIPVMEFEATDQVNDVVSALFDELVDNVWPRDTAADRSLRLADAWRRWDGQSVKSETPPSRVVAEAALGASLEPRHFDVFPALRGEAECGTALYVLNLNPELGVWVSPDAVEEDAEVKEIRNNLKLTLSAFVDPFSPDAPEFAYRVEVHRNERRNIPVIEKERFGRDEFLQLEHYVEGSFDRYGVFHGTVRAFAKDPFDFDLSPQRIPPQTGPGYVGPFKLSIASFEQEQLSSKHSPEQHAMFKKRAELFAGLAIYRSGLRVMPYGRPESDFFGMEERRQKHLGREYWAHRRSFGRVAIEYKNNPNLHDKAGREGLIDNKARREMRLLVVGVLRETARRYFGSDAQTRKESLPEIVAKNKAERDAHESTKRAKREFRAALKEQQPNLDLSLTSVKDLHQKVEKATAQEDIPEESIQELIELIDEAAVKKSSLRLPKKPARLGKTEASYRVYRDGYDELSRVLSETRELWTAWNEKYNSVSAAEHARRAMGRHQSFLVHAIIEYEKGIGRLLKAEEDRLEKQATEDRKLYYARTAPILEALEKGHTPLTTAMQILEQERELIFEDVKSRYESYANSLKQLAAGADLSGAVVWSEEKREEVERRMDQIYSLAQLGITVEIIGHELNALDTEIDRNLRLLPDEVQATPQFRNAFQAHDSLMDRLNFLAPLRMAGTRLKERIRGEEIHKYLCDFFSKRLAERKIRLDATDKFLGFSIVEFQYRVYPVFVNLINNAVYWLTFVEDRRILLDCVDDRIVVADSGAGVDKDDIGHLFELFFSRKPDGRGVGLYLCRANLNAGHHEIDYIEDSNQKILPGVNFAIRFEGIDHD